jgi:anti-sigma B factor antagonist
MESGEQRGMDQNNTFCIGSRKNEGGVLGMEMKIVNEQTHIFLAGSIYVEDAKQLREKLTALIEKGQTALNIDMAKVDYIDSTGLGMLISLKKLAVKNGGNVSVSGIQGLVRDVFELTRMSKVFGIQCS